MRLFLDANVLTYVAFFESFLLDGTSSELHACAAMWTAHQGTPPEATLRREIEALHILYRIDDQARFDWLCSDHGVEEIRRIRSAGKRDAHTHLLTRLLQHRNDVYTEGRDVIDRAAIDARCRELFPELPAKMRTDALQFCEADILDAYFFVTNDRSFSRIAAASMSSLSSCRPSELPFVAQHLTGEIEDLWSRRP